MAIKWTQEHSVNVKEIDTQHKQFIEILNELYGLVLNSAIQEELKNLLDKLVEYAQNHFETEEKYFDKFNYKNTEEHKNEHNKLKIQIKDFYKKLEGGDSKISVEILDFLEDWLVDHLDIQDKKYIEFFNKNGLF